MGSQHSCVVGNWTKTREYVGKVDFATAGIEGISQLMDQLCNEQQESYLAKSAFRKICEKVPFETTSNEDIRKLMELDGGIAEQVYNRLGEKSIGQLELFEHYYKEGDVTRALPIAEELDKAVEQLREIEREFEDQAPKAAYQIACLYRDAEEKDKQIASLREVVKNYPDSAEAEKAEKEQDLLGVPPTMPAEPIGF